MPDPLDTNFGHMRLSAGYRSATKAAGQFAPPRRLRRGRGSGVLYALASVEDDRNEIVAQLVLQAVSRTFQSTSGSLTARLRRAVQAGSAALLQENLDAIARSPRSGGVACATLRDEDLYLAQVGTALACVCQRRRLTCLPGGAPDDGAAEGAFGRRADPDVRLTHHAVKPGDTVMLADAKLVRQARDESLIEALSFADADLSLDNLTQALPTGQGAVLVLSLRGRSSPTPRAAVVPAAGVPRERLPAVEEATVESPEASPAAAPEPYPDLVESAEREASTGPTLAERLSSVREATSRRLATARPVAGDWLRRLMPSNGSRYREQRRPAARKPRGKRAAEDSASWRWVALLLPIVAGVLVGITYRVRAWNRQLRYAELMAEAARQLEIAATADQVAARQALEAALLTLDEAVEIASSDETISSQRADVQVRLDALNKVVRLRRAELLYSYGSTRGADQLVVHGDDIYVLDRLADRVYHHRLNKSGTALESDEETLLVRKGDKADTNAAVDELVGMTWMPGGAGRLLILGQNGLLLAYDPTWERLTGTMLPASETWQRPVAVSNYTGNLYVLDPGLGQVFRYRPSGNGYVLPPEPYLSEGTPGIVGAVDMAIDGFIYFLFEDGHLEKYLSGEPVPISLTLPDRPPDRPSAIYAAPDEEALFLYLADPPSRRVLRCDKEGHLIQQFVLEGSDALGDVRDIFVDEVGNRLFWLSAGQLLVMNIPPP